MIYFRLGSLVFLTSVLFANIYRESSVWILAFMAIMFIGGILVFPKSWKGILILTLITVTSHSWTLYHHETHQGRDQFLREQTAHGEHKTTLHVQIQNLYKVDDRHRKYRVRLLGVGLRSQESAIRNQENLGTSNIQHPTEKKEIGLILSIPRNLTLQPGEQIEVIERVFFPENFSETFSYQDWLHMQKIYGNVYANTWKKLDCLTSHSELPVTRGQIPESEKKKTGNGKLATGNCREGGGVFAAAKSWSYDIIAQLYPEKHGKFLAGILLGERRDIDEQTKTQFIRSGLMHIIAVSGFNITILIVFCTFFFRALPVPIRIMATLLVIIGFVGIVGLQPPVVRAAIMGSIAYVGLLYGEKLHTLHLLLATLIGFVIINPLTLVYDLSMLLSFGAVLGILVFQKPIGKVCRWMTNFFEFRDAVVMTLCSLIFTLPISLVFFEQLSIISPVANVLAAAAIPPAMLFGFLSIIIFPLHEGIATGIGWIAWVVLNYILEVVRFTGDLSWASIPIKLDAYRWYVFWGYYGLVFFLMSTRRVAGDEG